MLPFATPSTVAAVLMGAFEFGAPIHSRRRDRWSWYAFGIAALLTISVVIDGVP